MTTLGDNLKSPLKTNQKQTPPRKKKEQRKQKSQPKTPDVDITEHKTGNRASKKEERQNKHAENQTKE